MPHTARELIIDAYYLSGVSSRDLQTVTGSQITDGLTLLNELLAVKGMTGALIPYYKEYQFNAVVGQEKYFIENLIDIETFTFTIDTVRYSTYPEGRREYFGSGRANDIQSLPYSWRMERTLDGTDLYLYFLPDVAYPLTIWGKFGFEEITDLCLDLRTLYDRYYMVYLRYALAEYICEYNGITFKPQAAAKLKQLEEKLTYISPIDLSIRKQSTLQRKTSLNYGDINIGQGWRP